MPEPLPSLLTYEQYDSFQFLIRELTAKKEELVIRQEFEGAARCRDAVEALKRLLARLHGG